MLLTILLFVVSSIVSLVALIIDVLITLLFFFLIIFVLVVFLVRNKVVAFAIDIFVVQDDDFGKVFEDELSVVLLACELRAEEVQLHEGVDFEEGLQVFDGINLVFANRKTLEFLVDSKLLDFPGFEFVVAQLNADQVGDVGEVVQVLQATRAEGEDLQIREAFQLELHFELQFSDLYSVEIQFLNFVLVLLVFQRIEEFFRYLDYKPSNINLLLTAIY